MNYYIHIIIIVIFMLPDKILLRPEYRNLKLHCCITGGIQNLVRLCISKPYNF
jgi:hypothetical protein